MASIAVLSAGSLFPREGEFRVHSVFSSAVNLVGADPHPVALLLRAEHRHPRAAVLGLAPTDLTRWGLSVGSRAVLTQGRLRFETPGAPEVDLTEASGFDETVEPFTVAAPALDEALSTLGRWQTRSGARLNVGELGAPETALTRRFARAFKLLPVQFEEGARLLVGLGDGLTPSGDDVLVGWLAAARACGAAPSSLGGLCRETNAISASFLDSAERGRFPSALVGLAAALLHPERLASAFETLAGVGHSSGLDAATGFLVGLEKLSGGSP